MRALRYLLAIPAFTLGVVGGTVVLGIMPTMAMDVFIPDFHYTEIARQWVRGAGFVGGSFAAVFTIVWFAKGFKLTDIFP